MKLSVRRSLAVLAAGAALVTAGCGSSASGPDRAAVVDGTVVSQTELRETQAELNSLEPNPFGQQLTPQATLMYLVQAPTLIDVLAEKGAMVSDSVATRFAQDRGVRDPGDGTVQVIRSLAAQSTAQNGGQWAGEDQVAFNETLAAQTIVVNPRYGTFDPQSGLVSMASPAWIRPVDATP